MWHNHKNMIDKWFIAAYNCGIATKTKGGNRMSQTFTEQMTSDAKRVLEFLDSDPKAQELLKIYQGLPERGKDTMLLVMDAFIAGVKAGEDKTA